MSVLGTYTKQPAEVETYSIDYTDDLIEEDTVASAIVAVSPAGLTIDSSTTNSPRVKVGLSGGTVGVRYKTTVTTTTAHGRVLQDEFIVKIKDY